MMDYTFEAYSDLAKNTAIYPGQGKPEGLMYVTLGLCGEAGEIAEKVKKTYRDSAGVLNYERRCAVIEELGDVLWYLAAICREIEIPMSEVAARNIVKLRDRADRGKIHGSGDNR